MEALTALLPLALAMGLSAFATPLVARLATRLRVVDHPSDRGVSRRENMPLLGGLAVACGYLPALLLGLYLFEATGERAHTAALLIGGGLMLLVGVVDDRFGLHAWPKLGAQIAAAVVAIVGGFRVGHVTDPFLYSTVEIPLWTSWLVTTLWIVGITNAVNLVDGLDGLAAGVGAIIGATLTVIAWQAGQPFGVCMGAALVGALLGFLPYNFSPARIFLGDTGSLFIGFVLALTALEGYRRVSLLTFVVPLLALAVPILDTALSIVRRLRQRTPIFSADRAHMHHRLLAVEGSPRGAVLQFYFLTAAFCLIAVSFTRVQGIAAGLFLLAVALLTVRLLYNLGALSLSEEGSRSRSVERDD